MNKQKANHLGGQVLAINTSVNKGTPKTPVKQVNCIENYGLEEDAHAGDWHRQVSLLATESIEKIAREIKRDMPYGIFAENITTHGIALHTLRVGTRLKIGQSIHEVTQIGKECHNDGCSIKRAVGQCVMPLEGIFTKVIKSGLIKVGDEIQVLTRGDV